MSLAPPSPRLPGAEWTGYLTADLPGVGGAIKQREEDFLVEEQPLYEPCGEGEHIYLFVEKRGLATGDLVGIIAAHFGVPRRAVGYAGLKDKNAITRQVMSIHTPGKTPEDFPTIRHERIAVLWTDLHRNKLRVGHLRGNRFSIRVRGTPPTNVLLAQRIMRRLAEQGVPNFAGEQRFGFRGNNHALGRALLLRDDGALLDELLGPDPSRPELNPEMRARYAAGDFAGAAASCPIASRPERAALRTLAGGRSARQAVRSIDRAQKQFWLNAFQSAVFNRVLAERLAGGTIGRLSAGDVAMKHENGALFTVDESVAADPGTAERLAKLEISPSGPLWGPKMMHAKGEAGALDERALNALGVTIEQITLATHVHDEIPGARRSLRVPLIDPEVEGGVDEHGPYVRCAFELPPGAYATVVMREVMKGDGAPAAVEPEPEDEPEGAA